MDLLVVGAGPAGLSAAATAADRGRRVLVVDLGLRAGGQIWRHRDEDALPARARRLLKRVRVAGVTIASSARVVDALSPTELLIDFAGRIDRQVAHALIIATGAKECLLPFPGWTLPGVVGVGGLQALIKGGLSLRGARVVMAGTGPLLFPVAAAVVRAGGDLRCVAEQAGWGRLAGFALGLTAKPGAILEALRYRWAFRNVAFRPNCWVTAAEGPGQLRRAWLHDRGAPRGFECDWLAAGGGLTPNTELAQLLGCEMDGDAIAVNGEQSTSVPGIWAAGECTGVKGDAAAVVEGAIAGAAAAGDTHHAGGWSAQRRRNAGRAFGRQLASTFALRGELRHLAHPDTIICRCEDVRYGDLDPRWTQRQAKLWTRLGMGECQGAVCGTACAVLFGWQPNGTRPPIGAPGCGDWYAGLREDSPETKRSSETPD